MTSTPFGKVKVGVLSGDLARYPQFWIALKGLLAPQGSTFNCAMGCAIAQQRNDLVRSMLAGDEDYLFFLDDDHSFKDDVLLRLLAHNKDIVQPLTLGRKPPFGTLAMMRHDNGYRPLTPYELQDGKGLLEVDSVALGCTLIKRTVLEAVGSPWFEEGRLSPEHLSEDMDFCRKAKAKDFKVYVDRGTAIGHIGTCEIWPHGPLGDPMIVIDRKGFPVTLN